MRNSLSTNPYLPRAHLPGLPAESRQHCQRPEVQSLEARFLFGAHQSGGGGYYPSGDERRGTHVLHAQEVGGAQGEGEEHTPGHLEKGWDVCQQHN